ncbi:UDP-N-acetylmuramate dehydrogenase [Thalassotalea sp. LPB0316]|uniref:UDP-N-acetylmuramate dehydrogenase n=1 Tax=Thalassotalea sp. LPB0316 TaxID=2769490 RepID=UPI001868C7F6|nr:UDP-N-acetylmuramate dehydrogenase [Thalassotalea sp. LPB0316]QOL26152.1 UDP-N-acetylmuramate dehydrogenase [Thalassotalea sp. LPB0316]
MKSEQNYSLKASNSFAVESITPKIYFPETHSDLAKLANVVTNQSYYLLGEGSNTLFYEEQAPVIISPKFFGIKITEHDDGYEIDVGGSENWHHLVTSLIAQGIYGLENLALIPGTVGAAPVQNIGAYGKEFAQFCRRVTWVSLVTGEVQELTRQACQFGYRDSVFKGPNYQQGVITNVRFYFPKKWQLVAEYGDLKQLSSGASPEQVMNKVIEIRQQKLPDPKLLPNAGSFFKNPVVDSQTAEQLKASYPNIPTYPVTNNQVKLAAGWLIEQAGLKGYQQDGVGVHQEQALVLVNFASESGAAVIKLAKHVQKTVQDKFGIKISPEVRLISHQGEQDFDQIVVGQTC